VTDNEIPNFFIIGAAKSGTTTLANALRRHPEVFVPEIKETQHFSDDERYRRGMEEYVRQHFAGAGRFQARGEATPHYIVFEKAARRIRESLPAASHRFIAIFRDPVERAYSLYWNMVYEGFETLEFEDAIEQELERIRDPELEAHGSMRFRYFSSGLYAQQLQSYYRYFERNCFLLLFQEDLRRDPRAVLSDACTFLGVRPDLDLGGGEVANPAGLPRSIGIQRFLRGPHWVKDSMKRLIPERARQRLVASLLNWNKRVVAYPPMRARTESMLRERYREDVQALETISGRDLTLWLPIVQGRG